MSNNIQELFGLLSKWAHLLPKEDEQNAPEDLHNIGKQIQYLCDIAERSTTTIAPKDAKKEPETDFKPAFIFQLTSDEVITPDKPQFSCVYDFCTELEKYCETSTKNLNIDRDWLKLILACSSHNYERFMWIHLTFQASNNLKLTWSQVKKRLQSKFDDPSRRTRLVQELETSRYIPELHSIDVHNQRFLLVADELEFDIRNYYVNSLPEKFQSVLRSTMAYDESKNFYCNLQDIQQRAVVFANADEGKFIFYSKVAHVALSLDHEKVNKSDCEFHLLAEHSTMTCPDYSIVKYPYMDFSGVPGEPDLLNITLNTTPLSAPTRTENNANKQITSTLTNTPTHIKVESDTITAQKPVDQRLSNQLQSATIAHQNMTASSSGSNNNDSRLNRSVVAGAQEIPTAPSAYQQHQVVGNAAPKTAQYIQPVGIANGVQQTTFTVTPNQNRIVTSTEVPRRVSTLKTEVGGSKVTSGPSPPPSRGMVRPRSRSPSHSRECSSSSSRIRSPSPKRQYREPSSPRRSLSPVEVGCYIHGKHASHSTKNCRQAQMIIPSSRRSESPPLPPSSRSSRGRDRSDMGEKKQNLCIFCKLPFKPGHLGYCEKVPPRGRKR